LPLPNPFEKEKEKKGVNSRKEGTFSVWEWPWCLFSFPFSARISSYHQMGTDHPHIFELDFLHLTGLQE
jgi:hypothetical protein